MFRTYWISQDEFPEMFVETSEGTIKKSKRFGNTYYYCGNVHVLKNILEEEPEEDRDIRINRVIEEREPFFTGESHTLFCSKEWEFI